MKAVNVVEQLNAMQRMLRPTSDLSDTLRKNACSYWRNQEKLLDTMQAFCDGWFARRHAGARAALEAAERICRAETPADIAREYQDWASGAFRRLTADALACQQHCMAVISAIAPDEAPVGSTTRGESPPAELRPTVRHKAA